MQFVSAKNLLCLVSRVYFIIQFLVVPNELIRMPIVIVYYRLPWRICHLLLR